LLRTKNAGLLSLTAFGVLFLLLALSPLIRGGNRYVALMVLEWLSLLGLSLLAFSLLSVKGRALGSSQHSGPLRLVEWILILSPLGAAFLFLTPVPGAIWFALPGRDLYSHVLSSDGRPLSLTPDATVASLLASIPLVAAFMLARTAGVRQIMLLPAALVMIGLLEAVWGLLQVGPFKELYFGAEFAGGLIGSFANANHFANYLSMTLPLAIYLLWQLIPHRQRRDKPLGQLRAIFWSLALLLMVMAILASGSRAGVVIGFLVATFTVVLLLSQVSRNMQRWCLMGSGVLLLVILAIAGMNTLLLRFDISRLDQDVSFRWMLAKSTWQAGLAFWPIGSGPGSYSAVYPLFQAPGLRGYAEHAHNDYVQLMMEGGAMFVLLACLFLWMVVRQAIVLWVAIEREEHDRSHLFLQLSCGLGLLALLIHSWVDFNLHIPANVMLFACLLGVLMRPVQAEPPAFQQLRGHE